ncbi:MAG: hypothetical protein ACI4OJ_06330 [Lachnospiraceae bacterium]
MERFSFPKESMAFLIAAGEQLLSRREAPTQEEVLRAYEASGYCDTLLMSYCRTLGQALDLSPYTVHAVLLLQESQKAEIIYQRYDPTGKLYTDTFSDLSCKIKECMRVKGIIGIFPVGWYHIFFTGHIARLGRLEYELTTMPAGLEGAGKPAVSIHIPSGGEAFDACARQASYAMAGAFFRKHFAALFPDAVPAFCESWLLYPPYRGVFPTGSNLASFPEDFALQKTIPDPAFCDAWRIFGAYAGLEPEDLPGKTGLQKAMKQYLKGHGPTGFGLGIRAL